MNSLKLNYDPNEVAARAAGDIKFVCKNFQNRFSGSQGERDAASFLAQKLGEGTDDVRVEPFKVRPRAYFGWIIFTVTCLLLAFVSYFFSALVSLMFILLGITPYLAEYVFFKRLYDPLFEEGESQNVYAVKHCAGEVKKRIVLVAHYDAGNEWLTKYALGTVMFVIHRALNILGIAYLFAINIARWALVGGIGAGIASGPMLIAGLVGAAFVIPWGATYFFISPNRVTDCASDGLSGATAAIYALNSLKDVQFENTEVCVLLAGSGEVGLRGAMAFAEAHANEFGDETVFAVCNILREKQTLTVNCSELNGFVKSDDELVQTVFDCAKEMGLDCRKHSPLFSNTESGIFSRAGLRSVGLNAVGRDLPEYFRTRNDSYDHISEESIAVGYRLALEFVSRISGEGSFEFAEVGEDSPQPEQSPDGKEQ